MTVQEKMCARIVRRNGQRMKKRLAVLVLAAALAAGTMAGCGTFDGSDTVVEIGDTKVTADVANFYARYTQASYETYYASFMGDEMWSGEADQGVTYEESVKETIMEGLKQFYVLDRHKDEFDVSLTEEEETAISNAAKEFSDGNTQENKQAVSGDKKTVEEFLRLLTVQNKMAEAIGNTVDTEVSDEEAAQKSMQYVYFSFTKTDEDGNSSQMTDEEKAALKETAQAFADGASQAADYAAYAESQGYTASTQTFDSSSTAMDSNIITAADAMEEGQVSEVLEGASGYYVVKLTSLLDREATDSKKQEIIQTRKDEALQDQVAAWLEEDGVKVHESVWNKIDFEKQGVVIKDTASEE